MADIDLDAVLTPMSSAYIQQQMYAVFDRLGVDRSQWSDYYAMHAFVRGTSIVLSAVSQFVSVLGRAQYLDTASTTWLRLKSKFDYNIDYVPASQASGSIVIRNNGAGVFMFDADECVVSSPTTGKNYVVTQAFTLNAHSTSAPLPILAVEAGTDSNAPANTITQAVSALTNTVITNPAAVTGTDDESNAQLRQRVRDSIALGSPANPTGAYEAAVKGALRTDGSPIGVTRALPVPDGFGNVVTYVATNTAPISDPDDLARLNQIVQDTVEPLSVNATVAPATPKYIAVTAGLYTTGFKTDPEVQQLAGAALLQFASKQKIGGDRNLTALGRVYRDQLVIALGASDPSIFHVVLDAPLTDVTIQPHEFPVFSPVNISVLS